MQAGAICLAFVMALQPAQRLVPLNSKYAAVLVVVRMPITMEQGSSSGCITVTSVNLSLPSRLAHIIKSVMTNVF